MRKSQFMRRNDEFHYSGDVYFIRLAVVEWLDVCTRIEYKKY